MVCHRETRILSKGWQEANPFCRPGAAHGWGALECTGCFVNSTGMHHLMDSQVACEPLPRAVLAAEAGVALEFCDAESQE